MRAISDLVATPSDLHAGSTVGLMPPTWERVESGNVIAQNPEQRILWQQWRECWERVAELRLLSPTWPRLHVFAHGDMVDGDHHHTTQLISDRIDEQERLAEADLRHGLEIAGFDPDRDELRFLAGTPAHVGEGGSSEERLARAFLPRTKLDGAVLYEHLPRRIAGVLFDMAHHGPGAGARIWTRENPFTWHLKSEYLSRLQRGHEMPRFYLRGHRHQFVSAAPIRDPLGKTICEGFLLPSFTFKTHFANRVAGDSLPNVGMWLGILYADGGVDWECPLLRLPPEPIIED